MEVVPRDRGAKLMQASQVASVVRKDKVLAVECYEGGSQVVAG